MKPEQSFSGRHSLSNARMDVTSEAQKAQQRGEPVALPAGQHGEPAVEHAQPAQLVAAGADGTWEDEMMPSVLSVDIELDNNVSRVLGMVYRCGLYVPYCTVLSSAVSTFTCTCIGFGLGMQYSTYLRMGRALPFAPGPRHG